MTSNLFLWGKEAEQRALCLVPVSLVSMPVPYDSLTYCTAVPPGVKDLLVWLTETPAPSDFCL